MDKIFFELKFEWIITNKTVREDENFIRDFVNEGAFSCFTRVGAKQMFALSLWKLYFANKFLKKEYFLCSSLIF